MQRYKFLIYLAAWKRPEITEICFMGISRLKRLFPVQAFAVISEASMIPLCKKYGVDWCMHENLPLGRKKNFGLTEALKKDWDFMIEIGSDDLLKNEIFDVYTYDRDVSALQSFAMINSENLDCRSYHYKEGRFGVGRMISRQAIESMDTPHGVKLWLDGQNKGLDNKSTFKLAIEGFMEKRYESSFPLSVGIKGPDNIWAFDYTRGTPYDIEAALKGLSSDEITAIKSFAHASV
jgi:hypothetical protein